MKKWIIAASTYIYAWLLTAQSTTAYNYQNMGTPSLASSSGICYKANCPASSVSHIS